MTTKFHKKNQVLFIKRQTVEGTPETGHAGTDALALTTLEASGVTTETGSYEYIGDSLSRDEFTFTKDQTADFTAETPQQIIGTLSGSMTVDQTPLSLPLQACGGNVTVLASAMGSFAAGTAFVDNTVASDDLLTIQHRKTSSDDLVNQKNYVYYDIRGMVDVSANVGDVPKLKFTFKGNASAPVASTILKPNFSLQTTSVCSAILKDTIVKAEIASLASPTTSIGVAVSTITKVANIATITFASAHSLGANGSIIALRVGGATDALYNGDFIATIISTTAAVYWMIDTPASNASGTLTATKGAAAKSFCFSTLQAPNFFGFNYTRFITGCVTGYSKTAIPTDVTVAILEDQVGTASFDPDANLQEFFGAQVKYGLAAGKYVTYKWDKLQLTNVKSDAVGDYEGRGITFRNTGKSYMIYE